MGTGVGTAVARPSIANSATSPSPVGATVYPLGTPSTTGTPEAELPPPATAVWLREHATAFTTAEPNDDFSDLQPLKQLIGDARIVALGEATHGTHEFFVMKHRLLRFLVTEMGFTTFAMEANLPEADRINHYVQTGTGDPQALLKGLHFLTWYTQEVLDMLRWMQAHNEHPNTAHRVRFSGFDLQYIDVATGNVLGYLRRVDPPAVMAAEARFAYPGTYRPGQNPLALLPSAPTQTQMAYLANVRAIHDDLLASRARYEGASTPEAFADAVQSARIVVQAVDMFIALGRKEYGMRDQYMAENVSWLLDRAGEGAKIILSAHNQHVGTLPYSDAAVKSMGMWLRERYGGAMHVAGQTLYAGNCNVVEGEFTEVAIPPPPMGSYEAAFHAVALPRMLVDLRGIRSGTAATDWLMGPHPLRSIGATYDEAVPEKYFSTVRLPEKFDTLISFEDTTASRLLPLI